MSEPSLSPKSQIFQSPQSQALQSEPKPSNQYTSIMTVPQEENTVDVKFGTTIQQFGTQFSTALSKHKLKVVLDDDNYNAWYRPVHEVIRALDYVKYLEVDEYKDPGLTKEQDEKVKFIM